MRATCDAFLAIKNHVSDVKLLSFIRRLVKINPEYGNEGWNMINMLICLDQIPKYTEPCAVHDNDMIQLLRDEGMQHGLKYFVEVFSKSVAMNTAGVSKQVLLTYSNVRQLWNRYSLEGNLSTS